MEWGRRDGTGRSCQRRDGYGSTQARRHRGDRNPARGRRRHPARHLGLRAGGSHPPDWIDEARANLASPGKYLAYEDSGRRIVVPVAREWTRIGRSLAADVRFDDSTVSRRHALIVAQADGVRVLDDRSLNGVYVNGRRVEWSPLTDGDEIIVGRHTIHFMDTAAAGAGPLPDSAAGRRRGVARAAARLLRLMAETIAVLSLKGGTGKTTAVRTLADVFRRIGLDVLCVDLDPQGNLSDYFDVPADASPTIADVLAGDAKAKAATHDGIVPASPILAEVERGLSGKMGRELVLRKALKEARKQHDLILIDCPPALGLLTINGLVASDWALISSEAQYFALQGVNGALEVVEQAKEFYNDDLEFLGVLMNIADMRTVHSREAYASLQEHFGDKVFETVVRQSIAYAESAESGRSILDSRPDLGRDYLELAAEVLARTGLTGWRRKLTPLLSAA